MRRAGRAGGTSIFREPGHGCEPGGRSPLVPPVSGRRTGSAPPVIAAQERRARPGFASPGPPRRTAGGTAGDQPSRPAGRRAFDSGLLIRRGRPTMDQEEPKGQGGGAAVVAEHSAEQQGADSGAAAEPVFEAPTRGSADELLDAGAHDEIDAMRHSTAHVMAEAVMGLFPDAKLGIGPAIENGFYYDF